MFANKITHIAWSLLCGGMLTLGLACAQNGQGSAKSAAKPYMLSTCIVSDEKLGSMGQPDVIVYEGQEVKFCCPNCQTEFRKNPAKYLPKLAAAQPAHTH